MKLVGSHVHKAFSLKFSISKLGERSPKNKIDLITHLTQIESPESSYKAIMTVSQTISRSNVFHYRF
jgi:hypothetical protein